MVHNMYLLSLSSFINRLACLFTHLHYYATCRTNSIENSSPVFALSSHTHTHQKKKKKNVRKLGH